MKSTKNFSLPSPIPAGGCERRLDAIFELYRNVSRFYFMSLNKSYRLSAHVFAKFVISSLNIYTGNYQMQIFILVKIEYKKVDGGCSIEAKFQQGDTGFVGAEERTEFWDTIVTAITIF
ncbi:hypothetical protein GCK72_022392 [Caenorhabditis remanei]|uniref:Uncharacterized protein n=1 Tax=Caenorhabditis remanei TaxID=31234 RepID=A0A6A5FTQ1_CAERE|nr:hypothetical protein GCK72_022392 [Caenorhabditis remanei]KAF1745944.1 hypothetical protein GCK72_022392 [Caenorhabditis remanei]